MPPKRKPRGRPRRKKYNRITTKRYRKKPLALKPHNFVERFEENIVLTTPIVNTSGNLATTSTKKFSFDMIAQHAAYAELFDEYKINKIVATFRWSPSAYVLVNSTAAYSGNLSPLLFFKVDHNDDNADSLVELKKSMKTHYKMLKYDEPFTIQLKPASQILVDANIGNTFTPKWNRWITTSVLDVNHLGLKLQVQVPPDVGTSSNYNMGRIDIEYKMYFTLKCNE
eukprot:SAG11_NODE_4586_length_1841_cov_143.384615_2_plen_226_part_00